MAIRGPRTSDSPRSPAADHPPLSVDDLFELDRVGAIALSPDGCHVVCTVTRGSMANNRHDSSLWLLPTRPGGRPRRLTTCGDRDGQPAWSPSGDRIAFVARRSQQGRQDKTPQLYVIAPDGGEATRCGQVATGVESFRWMPDGRRVVLASWVWPELRGMAAQARRQRQFDQRRESGYATDQAFHRHWDRALPMGRALHLLVMDLRSGRLTDLFEGSPFELPRDGGGAGDYDPHPDGRRIAFVHDPMQPPRPGHALALSVIDVASRQVQPLVQDPAWDFAWPRWRPDGSALAATAAQVGRRHTALAQPVQVEPDGRWRPLADPAWDRDAEGPLHWSDDGRALLFTAQDRGRCHVWRCDPETGVVERLAEGGWIQGFDQHGDLLVTCQDSGRHPPQVRARRLGGDGPAWRLEHFNDALLRRRALGEQREVWLTGALGEPVQMWLTFPPGFDPGRRHPLLQVIHGGPYAAAGDSFSLRWNPHVLAARGHVVAQPNFHGSSGFGFAFRDSIMGRQGELELQDIEAASDWLLRQRWADPKRLSASGGSYGGFLVAWMNGHARPGRYRCYVCHAGVFDRVATFSADSFLHRPRDLGAYYWDDMDKVLSQSPHHAAGRMTTPTLVTHGARDYRVPDCNGLAYYNTLKARGVEAQLLWFPDENHWVLKPQNARQWYRTFLDWVQRHEAAAPARARRPAR